MYFPDFGVNDREIGLMFRDLGKINNDLVALVMVTFDCGCLHIAGIGTNGDKGTPRINWVRQSETRPKVAMSECFASGCGKLLEAAIIWQLDCDLTDEQKAKISRKVIGAGPHPQLTKIEEVQ